MNNDKRIFALVSLGLCLMALLGPFMIAVLGGYGPAVAFGVVAGLLALVFGALSWSDPIGRIAVLLVLVVGGGLAVICTYPTPMGRAETQTATIESAPAETVPQR